MRARQVAAGGGRGRLQPGLELHPRLERVEPDHGDHPVRVRLVGDPRLRARPDHRRPRLDVQRDRRDPHDPALGRPPGLGAPAGAVRAARRRVRRARRRPTVGPRARRASVFDVIGKRRWFYLFSLAHHDPRPDLHPPDPVHGRRASSSRSTTPAARAGRSGSRTRMSRRTRSRRSSPSTASRRRRSRPGPGSSRSRPSRSASRRRRRRPSDAAPSGVGRVRVCLGSARRARRPAAASPRRASASARAPRRRSASAAPSAQPPAQRDAAPSAVRLPSAAVRSPAPRSPGASPSPSPSGAGGNTQIPTQGELGEIAAALRPTLGPIAEQRSLTTIGAGRQLRPHQPGADPHRRRLARHHALDHVPLPRRQVRRHRARRARSTTSSSSSGSSRSSGRSSTSRSTRCS